MSSKAPIDVDAKRESAQTSVGVPNPPAPPSMNPKDIAGSLKPPLSLVPSSACIMEAMVLKHGADKYGPFNWREERIGIMAYIDATRRHIAAYVDGENEDPESHLPHLAHARATLGIMLDALSLGCANDDRPAKGASAALLKRYTQPASIPVTLNQSFTRPPFDLSEDE